MKYTKHTRRDNHPFAWFMSEGLDFGALGVPRGSKKNFFKHGHVAYQIEREDEQNRMQVKFTSLGQTDDLWGEVKRSNIIKFQLTCQFQRFLYQTLLGSHK